MSFIKYWDQLTGRSHSQLIQALNESEEQERWAKIRQQERENDRRAQVERTMKMLDLQRELRESAEEQRKKEQREKMLRPVRHKRPGTPTPRIKR